MKKLAFVVLLMSGLLLGDDKPTGLWFCGGGAIFAGGTHDGMNYGISSEAGVFLPPLETRMFLSTGYQMHLSPATLVDSAYDSEHNTWKKTKRDVSIKEIPIMIGIGTQPHRSRWFLKLASGLHILLLSGGENDPGMQWTMGVKGSGGYSWGNGLFLETGAGYIFDANYGYVYPFLRAGLLFAKGD
ncbi:MAG: hypothetical protein ABIM88_01165 [candidate division WOR-3 bacterium]